MSSKILSTLKFQEWIYLKRSFMNGCRSRKKINGFFFSVHLNLPQFLGNLYINPVMLSLLAPLHRQCGVSKGLSNLSQQAAVELHVSA